MDALLLSFYYRIFSLALLSSIPLLHFLNAKLLMPDILVSSQLKTYEFKILKRWF